MLKPTTRTEWLVLLGILLLAAGLRFGWPGTNSFAYDEARLSLISLRMARGGEFAALGMPSSAGVPNLPAAAWIFALPYAVSPDPLVATLFSALLGTLAIVPLWWLARRGWGAAPALVAVLFLAASPYGVLYSRSIWAQNLLAPMAAVWAALAFLAIRDRRNWALAAHLFLAGFAFQVHLAGASLALASLYLFVRFGWWRRWLPVLVGVLLAALAALPFALALLRDPELLSRFGSAVGGTATIDGAAFEALARLGLALDWRFLALGDLASADTPLLLTLAVAVLLLAGLAVVVRALVRRPSGDARLLAEIVLVWLVTAPLFFVRHSTPVFIHYLLVALPALALLAGAAVRLLPSYAWRAMAVALGAVVAGVWSIQLAASLSLAGVTETPNGLGTPLSVLRDAAGRVPDNVPVLFFGHGDDPDVDGEAAIFEALWWEQPHRLVRGDSLLILPDQPATLMSTLAPIQAWEELQASSLAEAFVKVPRRTGAEPYVFTAYDGVTEPGGFNPIAPVRFEDGTRLEGWRVRWVGPRLRVSTLWRIDAAPPDVVLQQFHHLRPAADADTAEFAGADVPLSAHRWQVGDRLVVMGDYFAVEPGEYMVDIGHYALPDLTRVALSSGGDVVRIGPFTVD